ncbi:MAG: hypothetical protein IPI31_19680 [Bacteroidetes bacterium]|jgi:hypothetical protein|nr:hypothetical protein [Bacteroidota bacterium]
MTVRFNLQVFIALIFINIFPVTADNNAGGKESNDKEHYSLPAINKSSLEKKLESANKGKETIAALGELATYYVDWEANYIAADSLLKVGIELAELSYDNIQLVEAYSNYLIIMDDYSYSSSISEIIDKLENYGSQLRLPADIWKCKIALAKGYLLIFKMEQARDFSYQALTTAIQLKDQQMTAKTHLVVGDIQQKMNNNVESIRNFLDALTIAESTQDVVLKMDCYNNLSKFYNLIKAYDKSIQYKLKELGIAENATSQDSLRIMTLKCDLEVIAFNNRTLNEKQLYKIIDFAKRNDLPKLKRNGLVIFRSHLIKQNDFSQLYNLFHKNYPEELEYIKVNDTTTYYRLEAFFREHDGEIDSAMKYYEMAAYRIDNSKDKLRRSSFYLRYGDFLERRGLAEKANEQFQKAYSVASSLPYYEFMLDATNKLEKNYLSQGDYLNAYKYSQTNRNIADSLSNMVQKEELQLIEIENEEVLREQRLEKSKEETRRRNNIQYTAITIIIASAFLLLLILGGFKVSPTMIQMVGFVCFIFFFEFLILLFDTWIHHLTHGEPWKILGIKILLMCGLLPLHHMVEKRIIHYLINNKMNWREQKFFRSRKIKTEELIQPD